MATEMTANRYGRYVEECLDTLMEHGTDRYGKIHTPVLVSILDVDSRTCPSDPAALDEYVRVTNRKKERIHHAIRRRLLP